MMKNSKYILLALMSLGFIACESDDDAGTTAEVELTAGEADFSNYVSLGNSLTAGFTDGALFIAGQEASFPNIMAEQFAKVGGGSFTQPLMSDNSGIILAAGTLVGGPRLIFNGTAPVPLPGAMGSTDVAFNNPTGPFNNMGIPGAKSFHLIAPGYGNIAGLSAMPPTANPYYVRMTGSTPDARVIDLAVGQSPSFFSLWIGNNDVLGYALSGGDGTDPITDQATFELAYNATIGALVGTGAKGVVANIPDVTAIPHFTTVPHNPVPLDAATATQLNGAYAVYNGGLQQAFAALAGTGLFTQEELDRRTISFEAGSSNAVVIIDEDLTDLGAINPAFAALPQIRQATADDLLVLPASRFIGTEAVPGNPLTVNGVALPLEDKWVLTPEEQEAIATATAGFNSTISSAASTNGLAFVDANTLLNEIATNGFSFGNFTFTSDLVTGGAFSLDGVHPTSRGYSLIAAEALKAIDVAYGSNFEEAGAIPNPGDYPVFYSPALQ
ncbi:G-D-S-L family lipolytic protein [Sungkyunkwania multivorans]|uniref:G-D-S-L family lipolytic protein n=1 Tax=Sungkyunkwania multivorans TaxID=1173618 RepID=A0ABW3D2W1_9FLAO